MLKFKLLLGQIFNQVIIRLIDWNHKLLKFIPNGRYVSLDLKRSSISINTIFDVGGNIGQTCISFSRSFPKARIFSFEPILATYKHLVENTQKHPSVSCINVALGEKEEVISIQAQHNSETHSLNLKAVDEGMMGTIVRVETGGGFCQLNNISSIDLLKIDTEGYELQVLNGFATQFLKENVKFIYTEVGFNKSDILKTHYSDLEAYLSEIGFTTSGFYEPFRWGKHKLKLGFCNALFSNSNLIQD